jgi:hypothetical protein
MSKDEYRSGARGATSLRFFVDDGATPSSKEVSLVNAWPVQLRDSLGFSQGTNANPLEIDLQPRANWKTSQVTVGITAVQIASPALANRRMITLKAICPGQRIYVGPTNAVTVNNGFPLADGDGLDMDLGPTTTLWAVASAAGQTLATLELA